MHFPNFPNKSQSKALFSPNDLLNYRRSRGQSPSINPPQGIIFCYQTYLFNFVMRKHKTTKAEGFDIPIYLLDESEGQVGLVGSFGFGAPIAVTLLELMIAFGTRRFVSIGSAGALQPDLDFGDIVLCERAIRDEGSSYHYLKPARYAHPGAEITSKIKSFLKQEKVKFRGGTSWTTDAPYRETVDEVKHYQHEGVLTVEMEAAALFAVAEFRGVEIGSLFTISDSLARFKWEPGFHNKKTKSGLEVLFGAAYSVLRDQAEVLIKTY
ncbi:nucleoside phosphorylase [candidate division KSB1 bacterium]|nr:nucleoside phosphorylase [candidate division KSB1 bacterium]